MSRGWAAMMVLLVGGAALVLWLRARDVLTPEEESNMRRRQEMVRSTLQQEDCQDDIGVLFDHPPATSCVQAVEKYIAAAPEPISRQWERVEEPVFIEATQAILPPIQPASPTLDTLEEECAPFLHATARFMDRAEVCSPYSFDPRFIPAANGIPYQSIPGALEVGAHATSRNAIRRGDWHGGLMVLLNTIRSLRSLRHGFVMRAGVDLLTEMESSLVTQIQTWLAALPVDALSDSQFASLDQRLDEILVMNTRPHAVLRTMLAEADYLRLYHDIEWCREEATTQECLNNIEPLIPAVPPRRRNWHILGDRALFHANRRRHASIGSHKCEPPYERWMPRTMTSGPCVSCSRGTTPAQRAVRPISRQRPWEVTRSLQWLAPTIAFAPWNTRQPEPWCARPCAVFRSKSRAQNESNQ